MGFFQKKTCAVCGAKLIFLESTPLEDGSVCAHCAEKAASKARSYYEKEKGRAPDDGVDPLSELTVADVKRILEHIREEEADERHSARSMGASGAVVIDADREPEGITALVRIEHGALHQGDALICEAGEITVERMTRGGVSIPAAPAGSEVTLKLEGSGVSGVQNGAVLLKK